MHSTARLGTGVRHRRRRTLTTIGGFATVVALACATALPVGAAAAAGRQPRVTGSVVLLLQGPFGPMLAAGSGPAAHTALYSITSDYPGHIGCTTTVVNLGGGTKLSCTGGPSSSNAEWPAYTTAAAPVAGPGVSQSKLGEISVKGLSQKQVTYNGHPLYLFDSIPGIVTGENWDEPTLPPWHGNWYLVNRAGSFLPRTALLSTVTLKGKSVLAAYMTDGGGMLAFPVYSYSGGAACKTICSHTFPPLIGQGRAGTTGGVFSSKLGTITRPDGTTQLTYDGKPLYFDSNEVIGIGPPKGAAAEGTGNGAKAPAPYTGTFTFVTP
jgi:predicted lipoprotein with Yx(FWY)xxD motif